MLQTALPGDSLEVGMYKGESGRESQMVDVNNDREPGSEGQTIDKDHPLAISPARISQTLKSLSQIPQSTYREVRPLGNSANALVDC